MVSTRLSGEIYTPSGNRLPVLQFSSPYPDHYTELLWLIVTLGEAEELPISWFKNSCLLALGRAGRGDVELKVGTSSRWKSCPCACHGVMCGGFVQLTCTRSSAVRFLYRPLRSWGKSHPYPLDRRLRQPQDCLDASKNLGIDPRFHCCPACSLVTVHSVASVTQRFITAFFSSRSELPSSKSFN